MNMAVKKLQIGSLTLDNPFILGPMAGVSDLPFRHLCAAKGAGLVCSEMVSCKGIYYKNKNTRELLAIHPNEHPISLQLFASDPEIIRIAIEMIEDVPYDILDFNMGCPVPKVVNHGEGSALMKNPDLVGKIVETMVCYSKAPVTIKIRKGFNNDYLNAVEIGKIIEAAGASAVVVHGRTREEYYSGKVDYQVIKEVKDSLRIPVIGSGDIVDIPTYLLMKQTGCDGYMIARGARGNPWIFEQLLAYEENREAKEITLDEKVSFILAHAQSLIDFKGEESAIKEMRKHVGWYTMGMKHSSQLRRDVNTCDTYESLEKCLRQHL